MATQRLDADPRTEEQKRADESALKAFEAGNFLAVSEEKRREAIAKVKAKREAARARTAELGKALGHVRDFLGVTQEALAAAIGSNRTYVSKLESGIQGGVRLEIVLAICHALSELGDPKKAGSAIFEQVHQALGVETTAREGRPQEDDN